MGELLLEAFRLAPVPGAASREESFRAKASALFAAHPALANLVSDVFPPLSETAAAVRAIQQQARAQGTTEWVLASESVFCEFQGLSFLCDALTDYVRLVQLPPSAIERRTLMFDKAFAGLFQICDSAFFIDDPAITEYELSTLFAEDEIVERERRMLVLRETVLPLVAVLALDACRVANKPEFVQRVVDWVTSDEKQQVSVFFPGSEALEHVLAVAAETRQYLTSDDEGSLG
jgi:hypothetical protein